MSTLIAVYNSEGCGGRCDAKCYNAIHPECDCICGGMNHGKGEDHAIENTRDCVEQWVEDFAQKKGLKDYTYQTNQNLIDQLSLF